MMSAISSAENDLVCMNLASITATLPQDQYTNRFYIWAAKLISDTGQAYLGDLHMENSPDHLCSREVQPNVCKASSSTY